MHLATLSALGIAQPLLDLLGRNPAFFAIRRSSPAEILCSLFLLLLVPPLLAWLMVWLSSRWRRSLGEAAYSLSLGFFLSLVALHALRSFGLDGVAWLLTGLASAALATWLHRRARAFRLLVSYLGVALLVIPTVFLLHPGIRRQLEAGWHRETASFVSGAEHPVFFLLVDELSTSVLVDLEGRIDRELFPHLAALADISSFFPRARTVSDVTELAVPAILTGRFPRPELLPTRFDHPRNLFTAFGDYEIHASEPITSLASGSSSEGGRGVDGSPAALASLASDLWVVYQHLLLPPRYSGHLPGISDRWNDFHRNGPELSMPGDRSERARDGLAEALVALRKDRRLELEAFLEGIAGSTPRSLHFLHLMLPHTPWEFLPSGKRYLTRSDAIPGLTRDLWESDEALVEQAHHRYFQQTRFLDRLIGRWVARIRSEGLFEEALLVLVADHGVSFRPGEQRRLYSPANEADVIPVPLLIKRPYQAEGEIDHREVSVLDILPTVLDVLGVAPGWPMDGRSVFRQDPAYEERRPRFYAKHGGSLEVSEGLHERMLEVAAWKYRRLREGGWEVSPGGPAPELVGAALTELDIGPGPGRVLLDGEALFRSHDPDGAYSPAWVGGVLEAEAPADGRLELAIAIGGRIAGTTEARVGAGGALRFGLLVPESSFSPGSNSVEILRIQDRRPRLLRLAGGTSEPEAKILESEQGSILLLGGKPIDSSAAGVQGYFSVEESDGSAVVVRGWAVDVDATRPVRVLAFFRGEVVGSAFPDKILPDVVEALGGRAAQTPNGFEIHVPTAFVEGLESEGLRLWAVNGKSAAAELKALPLLVRSEGGLQVRIGDGQVFALHGSEPAGAIDGLLESASGLKLVGWVEAEDPERVRILAFVGRRAVFDSSKLFPRPEISHRSLAEGRSAFGFEAHLPRSVLGDGEIQPAVFALGANGRARRLDERPLRLEEGPSDLRIRSSDGIARQVESGLEAGYVESKRLSDTGSALLSGWVADLERGRPALRVLVFRRGRLILSTQPGGPREDVARARSLPFDLDLAFTVEIPAAESGDEEVAVTMIAVLEDGRAVLLPRLFASAE